MSLKRTCDYCGEEIPEDVEYISVSVGKIAPAGPTGTAPGAWEQPRDFHSADEAAKWLKKWAGS